MTQLPSHHRDAAEIDPRLDEALRLAIALGAVLVLLLPAARGMHGAIGWLPLWLLAMPLTAWWALHRFRLPLARHVDRAATVRVRRPPVQARRRTRQPRREARPRAAQI